MTNYARDEIQRMSGYQPGEQPQVGKFIKLNTNENPYPASSKVDRAIQVAMESGLTRYPDASATLFRLAAAEVLGVPADWILCGNGSDDILTMLTRTYCGAGHRLRYPTPSYVLYRTLAEIQGVAVDEVRFQDDWSLPTSFAAASADVRLVFLASPNSPSGTCTTREDVIQLADALPCPLVVDEAYADFADANCLDLVARNEKILVTRSFSKAYSLAGLRFGFVVGQPAMLEQIAKVKDSYNCDMLSISGAAAAISDRDWLRDNQRVIRSTRSRMETELAELGFSVQPSQANFIWCTHSERPAKSLYEQLKKQRVLVRYMNYADWGDGLRITVGTDAQFDACRTLLAGMV